MSTNTNTVNTTETKSLGQLVKEALGPTEKYTPPTYEELITRAKKYRSNGDMFNCIKTANELIIDKGYISDEVFRLIANALIDMDLPYAAEYFINKSYEVSNSKMALYKNADVVSRIAYKKGDYVGAISTLLNKRNNSEDPSRENPLLLWYATAGEEDSLAPEYASEILKGRTIYECSPYEKKSLVFYDYVFGKLEYRNDQRLQDEALEALEAEDVDVGPWCYILAFTNYEDKDYIVNKFHSQKYFFESSILLDQEIPKEFLEYRKSIFLDIASMGNVVLAIDYLRYHYYHMPIRQRMSMGTFPL